MKKVIYIVNNYQLGAKIKPLTRTNYEVERIDRSHARVTFSFADTPEDRFAEECVDYALCIRQHPKHKIVEQ